MTQTSAFEEKQAGTNNASEILVERQPEPEQAPTTPTPAGTVEERSVPLAKNANGTGPAVGKAYFPRYPGETPRAYSAFTTFFQLGHSRTLQAAVETLMENPDTVKKWSSKYKWSERIHTFNAGLIQQQVHAEAETRQKQAADWSRRASEYREQEWQTVQQLLASVQCYLENIGDQQVEKMTLSQASRALQIASRLARLAVTGAPDEMAPAPIQIELTAALKKAYGQPIVPAAPNPAAN